MDVKVDEAARELGLSRFTIYRLPKGTPGLYRYGRALRVNLKEFREWGRGQALGETETNSSEVEAK